MRKFLIGGVVASLLLMGGIGAAWAAENVTPKIPDQKVFEEMLPFMKQMHPGMSEESYKEMFNSCHSIGVPAGMMGNGVQGNGMKGL